MSISKIIHYIWIGGNPKSKLVLKCIESWKRNMPDYQIIEWNEKNYNINKCQYLQETYNAKKWAFASDFMRFDILYQFGGIYFDTDAELLKPIPDEILSKKAFTGIESTGIVSPGLIYGCEKEDWLARKMVESYIENCFNINDLLTVNQRITNILYEYGYIDGDRYTTINGVSIYPSNVFCGYDLDLMDYDIKSETISVHHYAGTWVKRNNKRRIQYILKRIIGKKNYKKLIIFLRRF